MALGDRKEMKHGATQALVERCRRRRRVGERRHGERSAGCVGAATDTDPAGSRKGDQHAVAGPLGERVACSFGQRSPRRFVMKSNLRRWSGVIAAVSIIVGLMTGSASRVYAQNPNPGVIPPNAKAFGMTYGEWSAKWWQWAFSLPVDQNPFFDEGGTCSNGANGQPEPGPVWFLTGVINVSGTAVRD